MARILVIDEDQHVLASTTNVLRDAGFEVVTAANGREGLQQYRRQPADHVITELRMPEMDGLEVIQSLTREYPHVKIIAMSGGKGESVLLRSAELLGASRALAKPFGLDELLSALREEDNVETSAELDPPKGVGFPRDGRDARQHPRVETRCPAYFIGVIGADTQGEGQLINISLGGCAIESSVSLERGSLLLLELELAEQEPPLCVAVSAVRWFREGRFGTEFLGIDPAVSQRLHGLVNTLQTTGGAVIHRPVRRLTEASVKKGNRHGGASVSTV